MSSFREDVRDQIVAIRETIGDGWNDLIQFVKETWPALTILLLILIGAIWWADPAPPPHLVMATGPVGSSNEVLGKKYQEYFAAQGIRLDLVPTEGSVENVMRLQDRNDSVMAAFVMSGAAAPHTPGIQTLGSINYQPYWCFYRSNKPLETQQRIQALIKHPINIGTKNSGTNAVAKLWIEVNGLSMDDENFKHMPDDEAIEALKNRKIESMCIVDTFDSPNVQKLLKMPELQLADFERAETYARLIPSIEMVTMPIGGVSLQRNTPAKPYTLLATTTEILVDDRVHPAIKYLFLIAARSINGKESFFSKEGEFPKFVDSTQYRSKEAEIFYERGTPTLMQYMPFWLAEFIGRLLVTLLPFFALAYPIIRSMPNYHKNRVRGKINRMYGALKFFEQSLVSAYDPGQKVSYLGQLDNMERDALAMKVPKSVSSDYYTLRSSIDFVRNCVLRDSYNAHATPVQPPNSIEAADEGDGDDV
jgi:hypothetical protein